MKRNKKGQFIFTTGRGMYKRKIVNGVNLQNSRVEWQKIFGPIPMGMIIHHVDGNKRNDNIINLKLVTITEHNRIHRHPAWNKGLKSSTNKKMAECIINAQKGRQKYFLPKFKETYALRMSGKTLKETAEILNISTRQVIERVKRYKELTIKE